MSIRCTLLSFITLCVFVFGGAGIISAQSAADKTAKGVITGKVVIKGAGGPFAIRRVSFYNVLTGPPPLSAQFRRLRDAYGEIDADGRFSVELPAGKYYMRAVMKVSDEEFGHGDGEYEYSGLDENGKPKEYLIKAGEKLDIGEISAVPYKKVEPLIKTAIEGIIVDMDGKPVEGASVFAYKDQLVTGRPLFVSKKTDSLGRYILRLSEGTYYLRVRNSRGGGPPVPGEILGIFGERTPTPITVKDGEIKQGINIKVIRFKGRGPGPGQGPGLGGPNQP